MYSGRHEWLSQQTHQATRAGRDCSSVRNQASPGCPCTECSQNRHIARNAEPESSSGITETGSGATRWRRAVITRPSFLATTESSRREEVRATALLTTRFHMSRHQTTVSTKFILAKNRLKTSSHGRGSRAEKFSAWKRGYCQMTIINGLVASQLTLHC